MPPGKWTSEPLRPLDTVTQPNFSVPHSAVDCHMHVFGPEARYPSSQEARYTLPEGTLAQYQALAGRLGLARAVFVQPSYYGPDNACLLDALAAVGGRGVVFLPERPTPALLETMHTRGVRGIRLDFFKVPSEDAPGQLREAEAVARDRGWHIELYSPGRVVVSLFDVLATLKVDVSVNHLGYMKREDGAIDADFDHFVELARMPHCWTKLTAPYRVDKDTARTDDMARRLIEAAPARLVWGSDWPHVLTGDVDTGALLNRLAQWCPNEMLRRDILVRNPEHLYQFERA